MFCINCGKEISDNQKFCRYCGAKNEVDNDSVTSNYDLMQNDNQEINSKALDIYLKDILSLHCIINKLEEKIQKYNNSINELKNNNYVKAYSFFDNHNCIYLYYDGTKYYIAFTDYANGAVVVSEGFNREWYWLPIEDNIKMLKSPYVYELVGGGLYSFFENQFRKKTAKKHFLDSYENFKSQAPGIYQSNLDLISNNLMELNEIQHELNIAKKLLSKDYEVNIIPKQFRNIYAIWFINDYISTSNESLSSAFLHCDLDEIKQKLDTVIEQQKEIIINQAIIQAQNEQMIKQNTNMLNSLASIEGNTHMASQYAKIAANNAEACTWISIANYIKK